MAKILPHAIALQELREEGRGRWWFAGLLEFQGGWGSGLGQVLFRDVEAPLCSSVFCHSPACPRSSAQCMVHSRVLDKHCKQGFLASTFAAAPHRCHRSQYARDGTVQRMGGWSNPDRVDSKDWTPRLSRASILTPASQSARSHSCGETTSRSSQCDWTGSSSSLMSWTNHPRLNIMCSGSSSGPQEHRLTLLGEAFHSRVNLLTALEAHKAVCWWTLQGLINLIPSQFCKQDLENYGSRSGPAGFPAPGLPVAPLFGPHMQTQVNPQNPGSSLLSGLANQMHMVWPGATQGLCLDFVLLPSLGARPFSSSWSSSPALVSFSKSCILGGVFSLLCVIQAQWQPLSASLSFFLCKVRIIILLHSDTVRWC